MIAAWMAYAITLGAAIPLAAMAAEHATIAHDGRVRLVWPSALLATVPAHVAAAIRVQTGPVSAPPVGTGEST